MTSTGQTPIPDVGTVVFGGYRATTAWGVLESLDAILVSGDTVRLPMPFRTESSKLSGNGWTITLATGWVVRSGTRAGDFEIARADQ